jgi:pSer/pThr/pTyr-binding forkhead associated (FHA) protein
LEASVITCAKCGRENEDHFKFCLGCGGNLDEQRAAASASVPAFPKNCPQCGSATTEGQRFCGGCGFNIESVVAAPASAAPAPAPAAASVPVPSNTVQPKPAAEVKAAPVAAGSVGTLTKINPDGSSGAQFGLQAGRTVIGRSTANPLFQQDEFLSPEHAAFTINGSSIAIEDLNSRNGVYYRIGAATELSHGDFIRIGKELLHFQLLSAVSPEVATPSDGTVVSGSPVAGAWGRLERVSAPDQASHTFLLRGEEQFLGRERGDILFREDGYVSGRHARVFSKSGKYFIEDLNSSNGTFLRARGSCTLSSGSLILLGNQPFRVDVG